MGQDFFDSLNGLVLVFWIRDTCINDKQRAIGGSSKRLEGINSPVRGSSLPMQTRLLRDCCCSLSRHPVDS